MQIVTYRFSLDVMKSGVQRLLEGFQTKDGYARRLEISLVSGSKTYELPTNNIVAYMAVTLPDGTTVQNDCTIEGNKILYEVLSTDIATAGTVKMQLKLVGIKKKAPEKVLVSPSFEIDVWESSVDESGVPSKQFTALETAIANAKAYEEKSIESVQMNSDHNLIISQKDGTAIEYTGFGDLYNATDDVKNRALEAAADALQSAQEAEASANVADMCAVRAHEEYDKAANSAILAESFKNETERLVDAAEQTIDGDVIIALGKIDDKVGEASRYAMDAYNQATVANNIADMVSNIKGEVDVLYGNTSAAAQRANTFAYESERYSNSSASSATEAEKSENAAGNYKSATEGLVNTAREYTNIAASYAADTMRTIRVVTQAQYNSLPIAEKNNGAVYFISDAADGDTLYERVNQNEDRGFLENNLLKYPYYAKNGKTSYGITYTINADKSITANGTATAISYFECALRADSGLQLDNGVYHMSGCPSGGSTSKYRLFCNGTNASGSAFDYGVDTGNGLTFEITDANKSSQYYGFQIRIEKGQTVSNLTFYPMLTRVDADGRYPLNYTEYVPSNVELHNMMLNLGESKENLSVAAVSVTTGISSYTTLATMLLEPGIYIAEVGTHWSSLPSTIPTNAMLRIIFDKESVSSGTRFNAIAGAAHSSYNYSKLVTTVNVTTPTIYAIKCMQNTGATVTASPYYRFTRIK